MLALAVVLVGCTGRASQPVEPASPSVRVASGPEAESQLLARTIVVLLDDAGLPAELVVFADGRSARQAIELGDADITVAYSGEEWLTGLGRADPPADPREGLEVLAAADGARGLTWLVPAVDGAAPDVPANVTFAFFVAGPPSVHADLRSISELSLRLAEQPELSLCVESGFARDGDGLAALLSTYSVRRDRPFIAADPAEAVRRVRSGDCVAGFGSATDGRAWRAGLRPLVDDLRFFPAFVPAPVVRTTTLEERPGVAPALRPLVDGLSTSVLGRANGRVAGGEPIGVVADGLADRLRALAALTDVAPAP